VLVDYHVVVDELLRLEPACVHFPLSAGPKTDALADVATPL
jgi:hypothetical protein